MYKPNLKMDSTAGSFNQKQEPLALNNTIRDSGRPTYASKPQFATRNRSIPLQQPEDPLSQTKEEFPKDFQNTFTNDFSKTTSFQEKVPLKDRIQRSDEKKLTAPQQLYLPGSEEPIRKIQIQPELKKPEPQQQQNSNSQGPSKPPVYQPSIGTQNKREAAMLGSKNTIDNKAAVADSQKIVEQMKQAEEVIDVELILCPEGCGRQFKKEALDKHVKVCRQVFQQKRQEFNSKQSRIVSQEQQKLIRQGQIKEKQLQKQKSQQKTQTDWKKQSEELRNIAKGNKQQ